MELRQSVVSSGNGFAGSEWLSLALATLLLLPPVGFAAPTGASSPLKFDGHAAAASPAAATFVVDTTDDPGSLIDCTDKAKKCTLRNAIQKADDDAGDDIIAFAIP